MDSRKPYNIKAIKPCIWDKLIGSSGVLSIVFFLLIVQTVFNLGTVTAVPRKAKATCGIRTWQPQARIVSGSPAAFGDWPWVVSLRKFDRKTGSWEHKCGAVLLSESWVLTAAHCVLWHEPSEVMLRLGEFDKSTEDEPLGYVDSKVQSIVNHPRYDIINFDYDFAMLRLETPVTLQANIMPICLTDTDSTFDGDTAIVAGWGRLSEFGEYPAQLHQVEVPVISNAECERKYLAAGFDYKFPKQFLCAGGAEGSDADACEGDSGGPLMVHREKDNKFLLIGISSLGDGCGRPGFPGIYARVSVARKWIKTQLRS